MGLSPIRSRRKRAIPAPFASGLCPVGQRPAGTPAESRRRIGLQACCRWACRPRKFDENRAGRPPSDPRPRPNQSRDRQGASFLTWFFDPVHPSEARTRRPKAARPPIRVDRSQVSKLQVLEIPSRSATDLVSLPRRRKERQLVKPAGLPVPPRHATLGVEI